MSDTQDRNAMFERLRSEPMELRAGSAGEPPVAEISYAEVPAVAQVRLLYPLIVSGQRVEVIELRPPAVADVEAVLEGAILEVEMHARMAGQPIKALRALRWTDAEAVSVMARYLAPEIRRDR